MESSSRRGKFGSSAMYIVDPEYKKKRHTKYSRRWCFLFVVLLIIAVVVGATVGIVKAIQSSENSGLYTEAHLSFYSGSVVNVFY